ncbi:MAG: 50S ribosomal protein L23 [Clostridia bacterium]|nr:50S ribosomal protein L23 [Clostridia bacterium]
MKATQDIIIKPIITEKSMDMLADKRYVFKVMKNATKPEIAAAVEAMFDGVKVESVNTISMKKKPKRLGVHAGYTSEWKKAIVTLKADSKSIAFFDSLN